MATFDTVLTSVRGRVRVRRRPPPAGAPRRSYGRAVWPGPPTRRVPAALAWQDASLPLMGRVRASLWLPTILLAACLVALVYLMQASGVATTGYDIQRLQAERSDWLVRNEQLKLQLTELRSLTWVESEAVGRLGMQSPQRVSYLRSDRTSATSGPVGR